MDRTHDISLALESYQDFFEFMPIRLEDAFKSSNGIGMKVDLSCEGTSHLKTATLLITVDRFAFFT